MTTHEGELRVDVPRPHLGDRIRIVLLGAENPDVIRGMYFDGVILDEFADMNPEVWSKIIRPALSDRMGWAIFIGTPKGMNHFYDVYMAALKRIAANSLDWFVALYKASQTGIISKSELDEARALMSEEEFDQEFECFPPGTLVCTNRGNIPIESIRLGDVVLTHKNRWHMVTRTMNKVFSGELVSISSFLNSEKLYLTKEHPVLVYEKKTQERKWVKAEDLREGDYVITPRANTFLSYASVSFVKLLAWYITEGCVSGNSVSFSLNNKNKGEEKDLTEALDSLGYSFKAYIKDNVCNIVVCNTSLCDTLVSLCGSLSYNKRVPFDVLGEHWEVFFSTLMKGDGFTQITENKVRFYMYTTTSKTLAHDIQILAANLGRRSRIYTREAYVGQIDGREINCAESYVVRISYGFKVNHSSLRQVFPTRYGIASRVTEVGNVSYKGKVYNLSVKQDESYVAGGIAVHNCSFSAALVSAYYGKAMAQAEDEGRITGVAHDPSVLVDTYWDLGINDTTVVWFGQRVGREMHWIDHIETSGKGLDEYVRDLKSGHRAKYTYGSHYLPHDAAARELGTGKTREETLRSLGLKNTIIVPRQSVADGINATRLLLAVSWFDKEKCERGIHALKNYQREWDSKNKIFKDTPKHDWASHSADAFRTAATSNYDKKKSITEASKLPRQADNSYDIW